jgi:hypothetical protein
MNPADGARGKAASIQAAKSEAARLDALSRLGTRAIIAGVLTDRAGDVRAMVNDLIDEARSADAPIASRRAARAQVLMFVDQALGRPKESVEVTLPSSVDEVAAMSLEELLRTREALRARAAQG